MSNLTELVKTIDFKELQHRTLEAAALIDRIEAHPAWPATAEVEPQMSSDLELIKQTLKVMLQSISTSIVALPGHIEEFAAVLQYLEGEYGPASTNDDVPLD